MLFADFSGIINYLNSEITVVSKGELMLKNNIEVDVKVKCIELGITQAQLAENINTTSSYVNRVIKKKEGVTVDETESSVGDFNVDIYATETGTDRKIIIENQLEDTNHDHLGKLITYASGKSADVIIWLVKHAREEHKAAIEWLNNHTDDNIGFFLCEIKLYRIGNSEPAVKFEIVEKPNDWTKEVKKTDSMNETKQLRYDYWVAFEDYAFKNHTFAKNFKRRKPSTDHWMNFSIGSSACHIAISQIQKRDEIDVELYITDDYDLYNSLYEHKDDIGIFINLLKIIN